MTSARADHAMLRVLIVDDDAMSRDYLRTVLRALQCAEITDAANGTNATQALARSHAELVFLDIDLAGGNGIDLIAPILAEQPDAFIVMLSAHSTLDNIKASTAQGARGFIVKPFTAAKIQQVLRNATQHVATLGKR
ncbi:MAG: response regulator [Xanthomonadales bacterium]|nr:response regulator [Xanthomonadales bacterium]MDZ4116688.1 response regulator [Xanthomonadaceae bacterium]MDZ4376582.1 response regulator [Xanthomonadaceae bacterium]